MTRPLTGKRPLARLVLKETTALDSQNRMVSRWLYQFKPPQTLPEIDEPLPTRHLNIAAEKYRWEIDIDAAGTRAAVRVVDSQNRVRVTYPAWCGRNRATKQTIIDARGSQASGPESRNWIPDSLVISEDGEVVLDDGEHPTNTGEVLTIDGVKPANKAATGF